MLNTESAALPSPDTAERVKVVVIGAGQAGLSVGYHLAKRDIPFVILDASERIGDSWRKRWDSLRLFTPAKYDGLDGMPFPAGPRAFPTKDAMGDYLEAYARRFALPVRPNSLRRGTHRVLAVTYFTKASGTKSRTLRVVFQRCGRAAASPRFTG